MYCKMNTFLAYINKRFKHARNGKVTLQFFPFFHGHNRNLRMKNRLQIKSVHKLDIIKLIVHCACAVPIVI